MNEPAKNAEDFLGEIRDLCKLADDADSCKEPSEHNKPDDHTAPQPKEPLNSFTQLPSDHGKNKFLNRAAIICSAGAVCVAILGLLGWLPGFEFLGSISPHFIPMAPTTSISFILLGIILLIFIRYRPRGPSKFSLATVAIVVSVFGISELAELFTGIDVEDFFIPDVGMLASMRKARMSPSTGATFLLSGVAALLLIFRETKKGSFKDICNCSGILGSFVVITAITILMGYLYGTPLLYGGRTIPMAATTAIAFLLLGLALVAATGADRMPVRLLVGPSTRARLLRVFLPLTILIVIGQDVLHHFVIIPSNINDALLLAMSITLFTVITAIIVTIVAAMIGHAMDTAEAKRKQAEEELLRYASIVSSSSDMMAMLDANFVYLAANEAYLAAFGMTKDQVVGHTVPQVFGQEFFETIIKPNAERCLQGDKVSYDNWFQFPVHGSRYMSISYSPYIGPDGDAKGFVVNAKDITEHKKLEEAIQADRQRFFALLQELPAYVYLQAQDHSIRFANHYFRKHFGDIEGIPCYKSLWGRDEPCEVCLTFKVFETGQPQIWEWDQAPDGRSYQVYDYPFTDIDGAKLVLEMGTDITERKKAQEKLQASEELFRDFFEKTPIGLHIFGPDQTIIDINDAELNMIGYSREEIVNKKKWEDIIIPDQRKQFQKHWHEIITKGRVRDCEYTLVHKQGHHIDVILNASSRFNENGDLINTRGSVLNVTEQKNMEKELGQRRAELAHAWRVSTMGEMASGLAHELNQPLCAILNYANACVRIMKGQTDESGQITDTLQEISSQADRAGQIIRRLRALVAKDKPRQSTLCINDVVEDVLKLENTEATDKSIAIRTQLADDLPSVIADPIQIEQVVLNIVRNAFDAMDDVPPEKRRITIRTSLAQDGSVELAVSDSGVGISSEIEKKLFEPFFTSKPKGLGVGLSLSQSIIDAHGGKLWAEPNRNGGATFRFKLPVEKKENQNPEDHN